jgi:hypothetical protein
MPQLYCPVCQWWGEDSDRHTELFIQVCSIAKKHKKIKEKKEIEIETKKNIDTNNIF